MPLSRSLLACVLLFGGLILACGDDDNGDDDGDATPTRSSTASRTVTPSPTNPDEKTPGPDETPDGGNETPVDAGTPPPPAEEGTPAVEPPDLTAFLSQFLGRAVGDEGCSYNPNTRLTDCGGRGLYAVNPPLVGQDVHCVVGIVDGNPEYIRCTSAEPVESKYYDIQ